MQIQISTETPKLSLRNLTLTTHSDSDCGGYNIWIEIDVGHQTCNTSIIDEYSAGDTLLWFGKYLGSCRSFHFETGLNMINFRVKTNSTNDFCPLYFYAFMENEQAHCSKMKMNGKKLSKFQFHFPGLLGTSRC